MFNPSHIVNESRMESLADIFKCFICLGKVEKAHLCPHCSKPCCYDCILKWLESEGRSQCPHCGLSLRVKDLINCRWMEDVTQQLQQIKENVGKDLCITHKEKLSVFCMNCKQCICHQCALWDKTHNNHVFKPLEDVCQQYVKKVDEDLFNLRKRQDEIISIFNGVDKGIADLTNAQNARVNEIKKFQVLIISQLEKQLQEKVMTLNRKKLPWVKELKEIKEILESSKKLKTSSKSELMLRCQNIMQRISELMPQPITYHRNLCTAVDEEFPSEIIPPYDCSTFIVSNFTSLQLERHPIYSHPLEVYGLTWRLRVFSVGHRYLSILFELSSEFNKVLKYQYKAEMFHRSLDPSKTVVQEFSSKFAAGECWGFNRFYQLDRLLHEGYLNDDDMLFLRFSVRPTSYYQKSKIQEWCISQLKGDTMSTETATTTNQG